MKTLQRKTERCKECGICVYNCPKKAISFSGEINNNGYHYTEVDDGKCIKCGVCYNVCPDSVYTLTIEE